MFSFKNENYLEEFISLQGVIEKYENNISGDIIHGKRDIETIDKFIIHILEEFGELILEIESEEKNVENILLEAVDIIMYLGTLSFILNSNKNFPKRNFNDTQKEVSLTLAFDMDDIRFLLVDFSVDIRRIRNLFPERKWHKSFSINDIDTERVSKTKEIIDDFINQSIDTFFKDNLVQLDYLYEKKYKKVLNIQ